MTTAEITEAVADTVQQHTQQAEHEENWILHHIMDSNYLDFSPFGTVELPHIELFGVDISITKNTVFMFLGALITLAVFLSAARSYKKSLVPSGFTNLLEVMIVFVRDEIARPSIGKGHELFLPYLLTVFFFILFGNLLGLVPFSATFTSSITVTAILAITSFLMTQFGGIRNNGFFGYFKGLMPHGIPVALMPVIGLVEVIGLFTKPFALAVRLFANMTAGHIVIFALISLIFVLQTLLVSPVSVGLALFIYVLELLIALLQAYIFTMLSAVFMGMAVHQDH